MKQQKHYKKQQNYDYEMMKFPDVASAVVMNKMMNNKN